MFWSDMQRAQIDAQLKSEPIGPVLDMWEGLRAAGGMPPLEPDHIRVILMAFRRERGDPVKVDAFTATTSDTDVETYIGANGKRHGIMKLAV